MTKQQKIYPISCQLTGPHGTIEVQIVKITGQGMLVDSLENTMKVNETFQAKFKLPMKNLDMEVSAIVVKTYDKFKGQHGADKVGDHMNELSFKELSTENRKALAAWLGLVSATRI